MVFTWVVLLCCMYGGEKESVCVYSILWGQSCSLLRFTMDVKQKNVVYDSTEDCVQSACTYIVVRHSCNVIFLKSENYLL